MGNLHLSPWTMAYWNYGTNHFGWHNGEAHESCMAQKPLLRSGLEQRANSKKPHHCQGYQFWWGETHQKFLPKTFTKKDYEIFIMNEVLIDILLLNICWIYDIEYVLSKLACIQNYRNVVNVFFNIQ
jgi:hypothetical protein